MNAAKKKPATNDLVFGLGATGMSVARYLRRNELNAAFADSRNEPPGIDELKKDWPDAEVKLGKIAVDLVGVSAMTVHGEVIVKNVRPADIRETQADNAKRVGKTMLVVLVR